MINSNYSLSLKITFARVLLIPFVAVSIFFQFFLFSALLFLFASLTDYFDGYVARKRGEVSDLGAFLDPIADKMLTISVIILVIPPMNNHFFTFGGLLLILRELVILSLRQWYSSDNYLALPVTYVAKIKTGIQMLMLFCALLSCSLPSLQHYAIFFMILSIVLSYTSLAQYIHSLKTVHHS